MFTVTSTLTRPSASISWFSETGEGNTLASMINDPLVISSSKSNDTVSPLSKTTSVTFNSYDDYQAWINKIQQADSTVFAKRNDYIVANGMTLKIEESTDGGTAVIEKLI
jgi:hypothetical protein